MFNFWSHRSHFTSESHDQLSTHYVKMFHFWFHMLYLTTNHNNKYVYIFLTIYISLIDVYICIYIEIFQNYYESIEEPESDWKW